MSSLNRQHATAGFAMLSGALLLGGAAACSDATAITPAVGEVHSTFSVLTASGAYPPTAPTVRATASAITVDGTLVTADPCFTVSGAAITSHDTLVVRVVGTDQKVACVQSLGVWHYVLTVNPRPSGVDAIRVEHDGGVGGASVVLEAALP